MPTDRDPEGTNRQSLAAHEWAEVENNPEFRALVHAKRGFIFPATAFFIVYYFALPILVGYWPEAMSRDVVGEVNVGYLFALSQFVMAWIIMAMYVKRAKVFDGMVDRLVAQVRGGAR
ncbi:MAG: DUF485 domain-containing protein [Gemmatimonadetes bacterium]|nr:DUF485 domain-containing protein [Gemmatimonadota bacterium]